ADTCRDRGVYPRVAPRGHWRRWFSQSSSYLDCRSGEPRNQRHFARWSPSHFIAKSFVRWKRRFLPRSRPLCKAGRAVLCQPLVHPGDALVQRVALQSLLAGDPTDEAIGPLDMLGAAKQRPRRGGGFGKAFGRLGVLLERNQVGVLGAQPGTEFPHPVV